MRNSTRIAASVASAGLIAAAMAAPASAKPAWAEKTGMNIAQIAEKDPQFDVLYEALVETGAASLFDGTSDYTVFAPTDDAFSKFFNGASEEDIIDLLNSLSDEDLAAAVFPVLAYHVTEGVRNSKSVTRAKQITMLSGGTITARSGSVLAAGSTAIFVEDMDGNPLIDIRATDGMIHVIDTVLDPGM